MSISSVEQGNSQTQYGSAAFTVMQFNNSSGSSSAASGSTSSSGSGGRPPKAEKPRATLEVSFRSDLTVHKKFLC